VHLSLDHLVATGRTGVVTTVHSSNRCGHLVASLQSYQTLSRYLLHVPIKRRLFAFCLWTRRQQAALSPGRRMETFLKCEKFLRIFVFVRYMCACYAVCILSLTIQSCCLLYDHALLCLWNQHPVSFYQYYWLIWSKCCLCVYVCLDVN